MKEDRLAPRALKCTPIDHIYTPNFTIPRTVPSHSGMAPGPRAARGGDAPQHPARGQVPTNLRPSLVIEHDSCVKGIAPNDAHSHSPDGSREEAACRRAPVTAACSAALAWNQTCHAPLGESWPVGAEMSAFPVEPPTSPELMSDALADPSTPSTPPVVCSIGCPASRS